MVSVIGLMNQRMTLKGNNAQNALKLRWIALDCVGDDEMKSDRVIMAYECCKNPNDRKCEKCPYEKECCHDGMPTFGIKEALATMKELKLKVDILTEPDKA